ncbi:SDR family NAD(P)-dependent oxidoreductase [Amnibacterium sp. CER49]|uniref:SDR family NAD(P)-dependent oxidoreductase n=1 Tax=Amnibacterium sp. CER49 TaxID=3039161 RepID=UPI0024479F08|nr:SDR family NAD(P)-dependent oxidoreductase [Amnibacterium sp. CER49]MDH2445219.1 SDR family NAD(P)-dependent oxidoreductase [Amnibacterium sp. CER49]
MSVSLPDPGRMEGRTVVVTGGSSGIGRAAAVELAALGATVAVVGRSEQRTREVAEQIGGRAYLADFSRLADVRALAGRLLADLPEIHVLANNAGGIGPRAETVDGFDETFQRNHLAGFLLTHLLLPRLTETAASAPPMSVRVVQTSSAANIGARIRMDDLDTRRGPWMQGFRAYGRSKLANILFTRGLARRLSGTAVSTYAFHPGVVATRFGGFAPWTMLVKAVALSPEQGAAPLVRLASAPEVPAPSGNYFSRLTAPGPTSPQAGDAGLERALWSASEVRAGLR